MAHAWNNVHEGLCHQWIQKVGHKQSWQMLGIEKRSRARNCIAWYNPCVASPLTPRPFHQCFWWPALCITAVRGKLKEVRDSWKSSQVQQNERFRMRLALWLSRTWIPLLYKYKFALLVAAVISNFKDLSQSSLKWHDACCISWGALQFLLSSFAPIQRSGVWSASQTSVHRESSPACGWVRCQNAWWCFCVTQSCV